MGAGGRIAELRGEIARLGLQIESLGPAPEDMPEMIESANLLRKSEHLQKSDGAKSELISAYEEYASELESMLRSVFEIQGELKDILREQSRLISDGKKAKTGRARKRSS